MQRKLAVVAVVAACAAPADKSQTSPASPQPGDTTAERVPESALARGACDDAPLVTLDDVVAGNGDGKKIAIDLVPAVGPLKCTEKACPGQGCCNQCGGEYAVQHGSFSLVLSGLAGCRGMDCNYTCEPFGRAPRTTYRFVGTYSAGSLAVERYCKTE